MLIQVVSDDYEFGPKTSVEFHRHRLALCSIGQTDWGSAWVYSGQEGGDWRDRNKTGLNTPLGIITGIDAYSKGLFHGGVV